MLEGITMKCADIMALDVKLCVPEDPVTVAASLMWDYDCGGIVVVDDMESKHLVGMVTDRDIAMCLAKHTNGHPSEVTVNNCMALPAITCWKDDPVETAIQLMSEYSVRRIPIVDENGSCVGVISQADLILHAPDIESVITMLRQISTPRNEEEITLTEPLLKEDTLPDSIEKVEAPEESDAGKGTSAKTTIKK